MKRKFLAALSIFIILVTSISVYAKSEDYKIDYLIEKIL